MIASRWIVEKLLENLKKKNFKEMEKLFGKYKDDLELQKVHKDLLVYQQKPSPTRLEDIQKRLESMHNLRKVESSGGTRLWFGDRRMRRGQKTR